MSVSFVDLNKYKKEAMTKTTIQAPPLRKRKEEDPSSLRTEEFNTLTKSMIKINCDI